MTLNQHIIKEVLNS